MGYFTNFSVRVYDTYKNAIRGDNSDISAELEINVALAINEVAHLWEEDYINKVLNYHQIEPLDIFSYDAMRWYNCELDIAKVSKQFPNLWFVITGEGEDRDDNWMLMSHNGINCLCQAQIIYEPFASEDYFFSEERR